MNIFKKTNLLMVSALLTASLVSCGEDENGLDPNASTITEDDYKITEKDLQKLTDDFTKEIDKIADAKEKELTQI